jgi:oligopeptidase B
LEREEGHEYYLEHVQDEFLIRTNTQDATNFQLMQVPESLFQNGMQAWQTIIPAREDVMLETFEVFTDFLVVQERKEGLVQLMIKNLRTNEEHALDFGEPAYDAYIGTNPNFNTPLLRYGYTSLTTPFSTFDYNMETRERVLRKEQAVLGGFNKENYTTERVFATARDGVKIPISLVYKKSTAIDGTAPLLQYAYGSYGINMDASFSSRLLSLLDRGFVYAICHIRGGQEMGRKWYDDGKMNAKMNTFTDFIDCSSYLISNQWADSSRLFAMGGSAGGLLMGAVLNMAPELYKGLVAQVPFVDVVTTMLDETIPLTTGEWEEWGNPKEEEAYYYMLSYSPYDNVVAQDYPALLVTAGLHDSQVQYWEPAKWVAKLREMKTNDTPLLFHCDLQAGHGGASGRFASLYDTAREYTFILALAGINA